MDNKLWEKLLSKGLRLKSSEASLLFSRILKSIDKGEDKGFYMLTSFLSALSARGPGLNELYGMCRAILRSRIRRLNLSFKGKAVQVGRSGRGSIKTINVMTPASIIASAASGIILKSVFTHWSYPSSLDVLREMGLNPYMDMKKAVKVAKKLKLLILDSSSIFTWASKLHEMGVRYGEVLEPSSEPLITAMAAAMNPFNAKMAFRGAPTLDSARVMAKLYRRMGYTRALIAVSHGPKNMTLNCLSNVWDNTIIEVRGKRILKVSLSPEDLGLMRAKPSDIKHPQSIDAAAKVILEVLAGIRRGPLSDFLILNAASMLYVSGKVKSMKDGLEACRQAVYDGDALRKLMSLVRASGGDVTRLKGMLKSI